MSQPYILPEGCKASNFKRGAPMQRPPTPFMPAKSSAPKGLPVKIKIRKELTVSNPMFNRGMGIQYAKLLEEFESVLHKKVLCDKYYLY